VSLTPHRFEHTKQSLLNQSGMNIGRGKLFWGHGFFPVLPWGGVTLN